MTQTQLALKNILEDAVVFNDGDWVESKDQDPDGDVRLIQLADVGDGYYINKSNRFMTSTKARALRCTFLEPGDLLVARMPDPLGRCCMFPGEEKPCVTVVDVCVIRPSAAKVHPRWLMHCLNAPTTRHKIADYITGTTRQRISRGNLGKVTIPFPPLSEQKRIAEILDRAESLRRQRRAALALLDELTQSIFLDMFGDPVTNPKRWDESKTLADVASIGSGITKGRRTKDPVRSVPYVAVVNVQDKMLDLSVVKTIDATDKEIERYRLLKNDLLLTEGGDADKLGRGTLWSDELPDCIHQNHIFRVRLETDDVSPLFLNWLVGGPRGKSYFLRQAKQTTGIATINMSQLKAFPMLIPPLNLQDEFGNRLARLEGMRSSHGRSLAQLDQLFASLQHRAFRGEL